MTAAATAAAVTLAVAGTGAPKPAVLTAAMVRQLASASRAAMAHSGRATIAYRYRLGGALQDYGTDSITFAGQNWNDAISQTFPPAGGHPASTQSAINRIVDGQAYYYLAGQNGQLAWYHDTNPSGHPSVQIPDPRTLLGLLEPSARFQLAGYQLAGRVRLRELRATSLRGLPSLGSLPGIQPGEELTSLTLWVDGKGVVHRMDLAARGTVTVVPFAIGHGAGGAKVIPARDKAEIQKIKAALKKAGAHFRWVFRPAAGQAGTAGLSTEAQLTAMSVTFSGIGQPQVITPPAGAIPVYGHG